MNQIWWLLQEVDAIGLKIQVFNSEKQTCLLCLLWFNLSPLHLTFSWSQKLFSHGEKPHFSGPAVWIQVHFSSLTTRKDFFCKRMSAVHQDQTKVSLLTVYFHVIFWCSVIYFWVKNHFISCSYTKTERSCSLFRQMNKGRHLESSGVVHLWRKEL